MPLNVHVLFTNPGKALASQSLGARLKAEREGRGFTLTQIAESTKIPHALLQALERNDLSRWPKGLYRRAFFRSYVTALGLRAEPLVVEFARLFPDDSDSTAVSDEPSPGDPDAAPADAPLALSWAGPSTAHRTLRLVTIALLEAAAVTAVGGAIAWASEWRPFEAIGVVALVYLAGLRVTEGQRPRLNFARRRSTARRVVPAELPLPVPSGAELPEQTTTNVAGAGPRLWRPAAVHIAQATSVAAPVARRTGQFLKMGTFVTGQLSMRGIKATSAAVMRASRVAAVRFAIAARASRRVSARGLAVASHTFWKGVRSAAEHAELLASRQLNRRVMDPPSD